MANQVEIKIENNMLSIFGDLDFSNVMPLYKKSLEIFSSSHASVMIDFSGLKSTNSAALAIIVNWMRLSKKMNKAVQFKNVSADIMSLAKASGLDKIIEPVMA